MQENLTSTMADTAPRTGSITLPDAPLVYANNKQVFMLTQEGELRTLSHEQAKMLLHKKRAIVCHAPYTKNRLGLEEINCFDILELFAFVYPARFCVPTPIGLSNALRLSAPQNAEDYPFTLNEAVIALLEDLQKEPRPNEQNRLKKSDPLEIAKAMGQNGHGWGWTESVCRALGHDYNPASPVMSKVALNIWKYMQEWSEDAPPPPPAHHPVTEEETLERLSFVLGEGAETREPQKNYARYMSHAFWPKNAEDTPHIVVAEAGTGVGKTLGYLAPASVFSEKNDSSVWVSTYTKNLQKQIDSELDRIYPHPDVKNAKVAVRKGRENYLCLLNLEETVAGAALAKHPQQMIAAGLMVRWAEASKDGDLQGGDFPGWLSGILGFQFTTALSDRRGECIFSACDHYHRCFVEKSIRKAERAKIVVANHALVMIKSAIATPEDPMAQRYVFDEAHHIFDAADSAFCGHLTARETHDLRRWIKGAEGGKQSRARGLKRRVEDLIAGDGEAEAALEEIIYEARCLPAHSWSRRLRDKAPDGATEKFLHMVYQQVMARSADKNTPYSIETQSFPLIDGMKDAAGTLKNALMTLQEPIKKLIHILRKKLNEQADTLESDTKKRIEAVIAGLERRSEHSLNSWINMLETILTSESDEKFTDWMEIERIDGRAIDIGLYRHWVNPIIPFTDSIKPYAHGIAMTSATLSDNSEDEEENLKVARRRTGADLLSDTPVQFTEKSPFDYQAQTKIIVINDVKKNDLAQVSAAYRELFKASGGGALGLFTAIQRLKIVRDNIIAPLEERGLALYAQHADEMDTATLVDIFREDTHACLLGTDAVRDGVDVPGESLRMLVYDRVPWPRPTILHKARRDAFGGRAYDEQMTRLKLRQAYGRLIRRATDKGVFVMMDNALPTRLCNAFPDTVEVQRMGLAEALPVIQNFLKG